MSVIVPFRGDARGARRLLDSLGRLDLEAGDEIVVVDNSDDPCFPQDATVRIVRATTEKSSYYARNCGALAPSSAEGRNCPTEQGSSCPRRDLGQWLVFLDADCVPRSGLLGAYFDPPPGDDVGALAGTVATDPAQTHFLARYAADRGFLDQEAGLHTAQDAAATANLMVRRSAFDEIGGFAEGISSGGDVDFCRRLVAAGWRIERRPEAVVTHLHRESLPDLLRTISRYASGAKWLNERYPGSAPEWGLVPGLVHCGRDIAGDLARRRFERAAFRGIDALGLFAHTIGYRRSNAAG